jgi:hypothetical protein
VACPLLKAKKVRERDVSDRSDQVASYRRPRPKGPFTPF